MTIGPGSLTKIRQLGAVAVGLMLLAPEVLAQAQPQTLVVAFDIVSQPIPLSDWLTAGIALLLAATAFVTLRRRGTQGSRLLSWTLVLATGGALLAATGPRIVSEANAGADPSVINLLVNPGVLDVTQYVAMSPVVVTVTNTTGQTTKIKGIVLTPPTAFYIVDAVSPGTCSAGSVLAPNAACTIRLIAQNVSCDPRPGVAAAC